MSSEESVKEKSKRRRKRRGNDQDDETTEEERGVTERKGRATGSQRQKQASTSGGNFIVRAFRGTLNYLGGVKDELDKVVWPGRDELIRLVWIVLVVTVATSAILGLLTLIYSQVFVFGISEKHPEIFALLFGGVGLAYFILSRRSRNVTPY